MYGAQPHTAVLRPSRNASVWPQRGAGGRMESFRRGCTHWLALNASELAWSALVIGGVVFTACLMRAM
jgi:hypothetical protein